MQSQEQSLSPSPSHQSTIPPQGARPGAAPPHPTFMRPHLVVAALALTTVACAQPGATTSGATGGTTATDGGAVAAAPAAQPARPAQASPRDTTRATVGQAELLVDYGRPSVRGRTVWSGTLVPDGQVWRLGANAATHLRTSRDLVLGGTAVPAGTYTLYLLGDPQRPQLIINRQTGQWGTNYDQGRDLGRVPMTVTTLAQPVEQLTIAIEPSGASAGSLMVRWADRQLAVPFTVK